MITLILAIIVLGAIQLALPEATFLKVHRGVRSAFKKAASKIDNP